MREAWVWILVWVGMVGVGTAQEAKPDATIAAKVQFAMDRAGGETPHMVITVRRDGTGTYEATMMSPSGQSRYGGVTGAEEPVRQEIQVSTATVQRIFAVAKAESLFRVACQSKAKNIADTGRKTLLYEGPDGSGSCTYNYSEIKNIAGLTDLFLGMSYVVGEGRRLEFKHRYDRLGLFQEMDSLMAQVKAGRATELGLIAPVLASLAGDGDLLERVRERATELLGMANAER